jgi:hypothetical protein
MITCGLTPLYLAFPEQYTSNVSMFDDIMNIIFFFDIVINFFTAYVNEDGELVDNLKVTSFRIYLLDHLSALSEVLVRHRFPLRHTVRHNIHRIGQFE